MKKIIKGQNRKEEEVSSEQWKNFLDIGEIHPASKKKKKRIKHEQPKVTSMTTRATFVIQQQQQFLTKY